MKSEAGNKPCSTPYWVEFDMEGDMVTTELHRTVGQEPHDEGDRPARQTADVQERTCTHCGAHTLFYPSDPQGNWYRCSECRAYA
jgi:hypothetical protein